MSFCNFTDHALRTLLNDLTKAERHDREERDRLMLIASETETKAHALGSRIMAAAVVREQVEMEIEERSKSQDEVRV